ncbi:hypothetical protein QJS66_04535 [Kocuria rhizophila]|nr:hypothetical protein QJS66_04535 [Kocuria rhizophila]
MLTVGRFGRGARAAAVRPARRERPKHGDAVTMGPPAPISPGTRGPHGCRQLRPRGGS